MRPATTWPWSGTSGSPRRPHHVTSTTAARAHGSHPVPARSINCPPATANRMNPTEPQSRNRP